MPFVAICLFATESRAATLDDGSRFAFTASAKEKQVYALDLTDLSIAQQIHLTERPDRVLASDALKALIVSHPTVSKLTLIDVSDTDLQQFEYALDLVPDDIKLSPLGDSVAIYDRSAKHLEVHAIKRRAIQLTVDGVNSNTEFTFSPDGATLYWPDSNSGTLHSINLWAKRNSIQLTEPGLRLSALSRSADGLLGFVSGSDSAEVFVIDLRTFTLLATLRVPPGPGRPWGTADGRIMFVAGTNSVSAISTDTLRLAYTIRLDDKPLSVHSGWLDTVAAIISDSGRVVFIDVNSGKELSTHRFSERPLAAIVTSDSKSMALPLPTDGKFALLDMKEHRVAKTLSGLPSDIGDASIAISNNLCH